MATIRCHDVTWSDIEVVIFDKDGTLANSETFLRQLGQRRSRLIDAQIPGVQEPLLMAFGVDGSGLDPSGLLAVGTRRENEIAAAAYVAETGQGWLESLEIVTSAFLEADRHTPDKADETPLFEGALPLLQALVAANVQLGILSSDTTANVESFVQRYNLDRYFALQMGTDDGISKPNPRLLEIACTALKVSPATTLLVGDGEIDMQLAHNAHLGGCIGVTWGWTRSPILKQASAVASQLSQIEVIHH